MRSLSYNTSLTGNINILFNIAQLWSKEPFYGHIYPLYLLAQAHHNLDTFHNHAILTICNNTVADINKAIFVQLYSSSNTFHFTNSVKQNGEENHIKLLPAKLLQTFNINNLPLLKFTLKIGTPIIFFIKPLP